MDAGSFLTDFDVIAFSLQYELDYLNVLWIIDSIGIPFTVKERSKHPDKKFPLLIGGGPCVRSNPLPMLNFLDLIVFSDLEPISDRIIKFFTEHKGSHGTGKIAD